MKKLITLPRVNLLLGVLLITVIAIAMFMPIHPIDVKSVITDGNKFTAGQKFSYDVDRCKNVDEDVTNVSHRYLVDVNNPDLTPVDLGVPPSRPTPRGCGKIRVNLILPDHIPTGTYRLKIDTRYDPGFWREPIKKSYYSDSDFEVVAK